jgi:hypothetical protein
MNGHENANLMAIPDTESSFKPSQNSTQAVDLFSPMDSKHIFFITNKISLAHEEPKTFEFEDSPDQENPLANAHDEENPISEAKRPKTIQNTGHVLFPPPKTTKLNLVD